MIIKKYVCCVVRWSCLESLEAAVLVVVPAVSLAKERLESTFTDQESRHFIRLQSVVKTKDPETGRYAATHHQAFALTCHILH